jgi:Protein of unknown function (DUF3489)
MNDIADQVVEPTDSAILRPTLTKAAAVTKLLSRTRGATMDEIMAQTHWQAHSARAFLSGIRKKGRVLLKEARKTGETCYRLEG